MTKTKNTLSTALDLGLIAGLTAFIAVFVNPETFPSSLTPILLALLALTVAVIGVKREAAREGELDEMELAAASFGARWGVAVVVFLTLLMTFMSPLQDGIASIVDLTTANPNSPVPASVVLFTGGLVTALVVQLSAKFVLAKAWTWSKR